MSNEFGLLFATPSFIEGVARAIDLGDTMTEYNYSADAATADRRALNSDWCAVGNDLRQAVAQFREQHPLASDK